MRPDLDHMCLKFYFSGNRIMKRKILLTICIGIACLLPRGATAVGIAMNSYGEIFVENLAVGESYSMLKLMNSPLEISYTGNDPAFLMVLPDKPTPGELKKGFEAIPDIAWIDLGNSIVAVAANGNYRTDVRISIPNDKKYLGKRYEVMLTSKLISSKGGAMTVGMGVIGRLLFTTAPMVNPLRSSNTSSVNLNFAFIPPIVTLENVRVGEVTKILTADDAEIKLMNSSDREIICRLLSLDSRNTILSVYPKYEVCPDSRFVHFNNSEITLAPGKSESLNMWLEIPDRPEYKKKSYQFLISANIAGTTTGSKYMRILVKTTK